MTAEHCAKAFQAERVSQDLERHVAQIGTYCSPNVFGKFLLGPTVAAAFRLLDMCVGDPEQRTKHNFVQIRDVLMLSVAVMNGRRTGELTYMTVDEFEAARISKSDPVDRIVFVRKHKVASKLCKINFYGDLHAATSKYVECFGTLFLRSAGKHGRMFPHVSRQSGSSSDDAQRL
jgi:hypothetical protein